MALEQTYNCEAKNQLFHGITQQPHTVDKYLKALPLMTTVSQKVKGMVHMNGNTTEKSNEATETDSATVKQIMTVTETKMINPFKPDIDGLVNIATGKKSNTSDLPNAKQIGLLALSKAKQDESYGVGTVKLTICGKGTKGSIDCSEIEEGL